jgi:hypothetical protein
MAPVACLFKTMVVTCHHGEPDDHDHLGHGLVAQLQWFKHRSTIATA